MLLPGQQSNLMVIASIFDMLNQGYMQYLDVEVQALVSTYFDRITVVLYNIYIKKVFVSYRMHFISSLMM